MNFTEHWGGGAAQPTDRHVGNNPSKALEQAVTVRADEAGAEFRGIFPPRTRERKPSGFQILYSWKG